MSRRPAALLLADILEAIEKVERYTRGLDRESFLKDEKTADSVVRNLEIIGEAANRLPSEFQAAHPEIEWKKIVGLRNVIVHDYFGVDLDLIWQIVRQDLPDLRAKLIQIRER